MRTPYHSFDQFREKAELLAHELALNDQEALAALARISGYDDPIDVRNTASEPDLLSSREELMARLQAIYPHIANVQAGALIDKLNLPVRETDMGRLAQAPGAAPNISG